MSILSSLFKHKEESKPVEQPIIKQPLDEFQSWLTVKPGSMITLKDAQALEDSQKLGLGMAGMDYKVDKTTLVDNDNAKWFFAWLSGNQDLLLMVKKAGAAMDLRVYMAAEDFKPGRRQDMLDWGQEWLFQPPEDMLRFQYNDLIYSTELTRSADGKDIEYVIKSQGEQHGKAEEAPLGVHNLLATIAEYHLDTDDVNVPNSEALILELGTQMSSNIQLFLGAAIRDSEIRKLV
jgi:hypothetical protein